MFDTLETRPPSFPFRGSGIDPAAPWLEEVPDGIGLVKLPTGQLAWMVSRHEDVRQLLRDPAFSSDFGKPGFPLLRPVPPDDDETRRAGFFIRMDGADHTLYRRLLTPEFMIKNMRRLEPLIRETVREALASMRAAGAPADLVEHFALPVPSRVICHLLGVPYADHAFFQERSQILLAWSAPPEQVQKAAEELREYLYRLIEIKKQASSDDLVGRLAHERVATGDMTVHELVGVSLLLLIAGHETTANMIGLSTLVLLQHPEQLQKLKDRPELIDNAVEELLRYLTIVRLGVTRVAVAETEVGGHTFHPGDGVIAMLSAANRDGGVFPDADTLDLDRGSHQHMAFGFGVHQCIGQPLARAELRIALAELVQQMPRLALAVDASEVEFRDSIVFGVKKLPVTW